MAKAESFEHGGCAFACLLFLRLDLAGPEEQVGDALATMVALPSQHVLEYRQAMGESGHLEGSANAGLGDLVGPADRQRQIAKGQLAAIGHIDAADDIEQR
ncbi:hypothetical protein C3941_05765 [Kaistia algarum]|nr:hypothetical protein C3941_05765 [Kaistia algarum]